MASIFSKIVSGEIPCYRIAENDDFIAFLDIMPIARGHVLVVPKVEVDKIFDVSDEVLGKALLFAKPIAKALESSFECNRCGISVIGIEVPHAHIHLVPIQSADDLNFTKEKMILSEDELLKIQQTILHALQHSD